MTSLRELRPLGEALGTEAIGVDLSRPLDAETLAWVEDAFAENPVLVFRNQDLGPAELAAFGRRFGRPMIHSLVNYRHDEYPEVSWLTNVDKDGGIDHFGMVVDSIDLVAERLRRFSSNAAVVKRPSERPFADLSGNDPDGNIFDLAQKDSRNLAGVHKDNAEKGYQAERTRYASLYAIRTLNPEQVAEFYATVFELQPVNRKEGDENYHLTDGRVILSIMPWKIDKFLEIYFEPRIGANF